MAGHSKLTVDVLDTPLAAAATPLAEQLIEERAASRLAAQDPTLWVGQARGDASTQLGWTAVHASSRHVIGDVATLRTELHREGIDRVVFAGVGGSSLASEVIAHAEHVPFTVVDTTDPGQVGDALAGELSRTVLVVSSKSGTSPETDCARRIFAEAFAAEGIDPASRMVAVTDPGSALAELAQREGFRSLFLADQPVSGGYSALTVFGAVPVGLAGADIARLLDQAAAAADLLATDAPDNPAIRLGAALAAAHLAGADKVAIAEDGSGGSGFGGWVEQLIAESAGKDGAGLLPVVVESPTAPGFADAGADITTLCIGAAVRHAAVVTDGPLGAHFMLWNYGMALASTLLGVNPFDQPDADAAKQATHTILDDHGSGGPVPAVVHGSVEVYASTGVTGDGTLTDLVREFTGTLGAGGYLAVRAYLDPITDASAVLLRSELATRLGVPVTFGWGPGFPRSPGQYHKGGQSNGVFLQITGSADEDVPVPGHPYTLGDVQLAQARGDAELLTDLGRPVLRLHLTDRAAGLADLVRAVQEL